MSKTNYSKCRMMGVETITFIVECLYQASELFEKIWGFFCKFTQNACNLYRRGAEISIFTLADISYLASYYLHLYSNISHFFPISMRYKCRVKLIHLWLWAFYLYPSHAIIIPIYSNDILFNFAIISILST